MLDHSPRRRTLTADGERMLGRQARAAVYLVRDGADGALCQYGAQREQRLQGWSGHVTSRHERRTASPSIFFPSPVEGGGNP